ncbi:MAG: glycosyltransferase [Pseudomonadota bacterium]
MGVVPHVLHCHSTFAQGGKELRSVKLINAFGRRWKHTIVSGARDELSARELISRDIEAVFPDGFPELSGFPSPARLVAIAEQLKHYDLVLTYNWGAMDVVMAHTVFARSFGLPPLIHHEDGFNEDEADRLKARRNWYRRVALSGVSQLVVPSMTLERIALEVWKQPQSRLTRIANGIDTARFAKPPEAGALRVVKREGEAWIGAIAGLRPIKQLHLLVEAVSDLPAHWHLVILGEGPEKDTVLAAARDYEISHRVHLPGAINDPARVIGLLDVFALSSKSEQFPLAIVEAMAAGLPIAAPAVGDIKAMVSEPNVEFIAAPNDPAALSEALGKLAHDPSLRVELGNANRAKAQAEFEEGTMIERYRNLYTTAVERRD